MTVSTRALVALLASAAAGPAVAQYTYGAPTAVTSSQPQSVSPADDQQAQQPQAQTQGGVRPSRGAQKAIVELQTAVNSKDPAAIQAKLAAAQAVAATKEDRYLIAQLQLRAALASNDDAAASAAVDAIAAAGFLDATRTAQLYSSLGAKLLKSKQYDQAARLIERASALQPSNSDLLVTLGDIRLAQGRHADALAVYQRLLQARSAGGQKPSEDLYKRVVQAAYDARSPAAADLARQWVTAYPGSESWRNAVAIYRNLHKTDLEGTIDLLRLMRAAGALTRPSDLEMYVGALIDQSNFIEAQTALEAAGAVEINPAIAASVRNKPKATEADLSAAVKSAQSGMALLRIGDRFFGLGEYAKAADVYRQAKSKGVDANLANLRLGMALARAGDKAGATAALNAVGGQRAGIAQFWLLYLQGRA